MNSQPKQLPLLVTAAVIREKGKVLITRRPDHKPQGGLWEFPGGKMHPGESPDEALRREILEELGLEISVDRIIDVLYYDYAWGPVLILAYSCTRICGILRNLEVSEHCWVAAQDLHKYELLPADRPLIKKLQEQ